MRIKFALVAAVTALIAAPAAANGSPVNSTEFEVSVPHEDLDLSTQQGVSRLDERVRTRIRQMCRNGGRDGASIRLERECRIGAMAQAERGVRLAVAQANANRPRFAQSSTAAGNTTPGA